MEKKISMAVIKRLPVYLRYLHELIENDVIRISSKELSDKMGFTASQIRQDLNNFGGFGQQGYGYNVEYLYTEISKIIGLERDYHVVIVGSGNLGQALAKYVDFEKKGFVIKALFDVSEDLIGKEIRGNIIQSIDNLDAFLKKNPIDIAVLAVPKEFAIDTANRLVSLGIKGIWNFTPVDLILESDDIVVENVHLSDSLLTLSYNINNK